MTVKLEGHLATLHSTKAFLPPSLAVSIEAGIPNEFWAAGPTELLKHSKVGFFCSSKCPGSLVLKTFDAITKMREEGQIFIGGFHSVMEWECMGILLRGRQPIIWVPARSIVGMLLRPELQPAFKEGRLVILSPFARADTRATTALAQRRNQFVGALADGAFVPHAAAGSKTLALCKDLAGKGKRIWTISDPLNQPLLEVIGKWS